MSFSKSVIFVLPKKFNDLIVLSQECNFFNGRAIKIYFFSQRLIWLHTGGVWNRGLTGYPHREIFKKNVLEKMQLTQKGVPFDILYNIKDSLFVKKTFHTFHLDFCSPVHLWVVEIKLSLKDSFFNFFLCN